MRNGGLTQANKRPAKKTQTNKRPAKKTPFDVLEERKRKRTFLLRLNDDELAQLEELSVLLNVSRSNVLRMLLKQAHAEKVEKPIRERAEVDIALEAQRLATEQRIDDLRKDLLARVGVKDRKKKGARR